MNNTRATTVRTACTPWITAIVLLLVAISGGLAQEPKAATQAKSPPKGLRIVYSGDSWHRFMPGLMERIGAAAGITDQKVRSSWALNTGGYGNFGALLDAGDFDVISWGRPSWTDPDFVRMGFIERGMKGNPNLRLYVQMAWNVGDGNRQIKTLADYDTSNLTDVQAVFDRGRKTVEALADEINKKHGRQVVFLVPVGEAVTRLRAMIVDGKVPGVKNQSELFADTMPHPGPIAAELAAYCNYAAIYRTSPEGLRVKDGVTDEQHAILQKLAWETVSKYPYAGIAKHEASGPSKAVEKPAPAAGVVAPAKAEALKGWNATQDLPDDTVVTDYNDYIERLPKAERPGVSDVKYYADGTGRNAVAVLVNVGGTQWTHLLVYDKQNKRTGVTKFVAGK